MTDPTLLRVWCRACKGAKNHTLLWRTETCVNSDEPSEAFREEFSGVQCRGCDTVSLRYRNSIGPSGEPIRDQDAAEDALYPSTASLASAGAADFPGPVGAMYNEVNAAMRAQLRVLAGVGLRTLIEAICQECKAPGKTLEKRIDGLVDLGLISRPQATQLHSLRFLGNAAAHETTAAPIEELRAAKDIAEALLNNLYILPKRAQSIKTGARRVAERSTDKYTTVAAKAPATQPVPRSPKGMRTPHVEFAATLVSVLREAGGALPADVAITRVGELMADLLTAFDKEPLPKGEIRWRNTVRWTRNWLVEQGRIDKSEHGVWKLIDK